MRSILTTVLVSVLVACGGGNNSDDQPKPQCSDGNDNDGDGAVDFPDDPGCMAATDDSEDSPASPQCNDGRDNDGDGITDYPQDPGCFAPQQDDETDDCPDGPNCPQCGNGKDDDMNGSTDYPSDPGCTSASDPTEVITNPVACGAGLVVKQIPTTNTDDGMLDRGFEHVERHVARCGGGWRPADRVRAVSPEAEGRRDLDRRREHHGRHRDRHPQERVHDGRRRGRVQRRHPSARRNASTITQALAARQLLPRRRCARHVVGRRVLDLTVKFFAGQGTTCSVTSQCGPGLVCRIPKGGSMLSCEEPMCKDGVDDDARRQDRLPDRSGLRTPDDNDEADTCPGVGRTAPSAATASTTTRRRQDRLPDGHHLHGGR